MPGQLNDEPADGGARGGLQQPIARLYVEFARQEEQRGQRVDGELTGAGVSQMVGDRQEPSRIGNKVFLPSTGHLGPGYRRDRSDHHTLADLQSLGIIRAQGPRINAWPALGVGTGRDSSRRTSAGSPTFPATSARMDRGMSDLSSLST